MRSLAPIALLLAALGCGAEPAVDAPPRPWVQPARGGSVVLSRGELVAYAADADNHSIHAIDLATGAVSSTPADGAPEQLVLIGEDRLAVTVRDANRVDLYAIAPGAIERIASASLPSDPWGIALSPRGELLVTSAWAHTVTALDAEDLGLRWSVDVAREPRAIVAAPDGRRAFVTHLVGDAITILDLDGDAPTPRRLRALGGRSRNLVDRAIGAGTLHPSAALAYSAVLSEAGGRLFVPHVAEQNGASTTRVVPGAYGGVPFEEETSLASVAVVLTRNERVAGESALPRPETLGGVAFDPANASLGFAVAPPGAPSRQARASAILGDRLLIASQGTNELIELDARALDPAMSVERRYPVGEGPKGVDVDPLTATAVVWNQLSHDLTVIALGSGEARTLPVAGDPLPPSVSAGRRLFFTETDKRISRDGRACAGCHPDGRDDGVVWKLGAGPRQTPTLVGRLGRGPYGWLGKHERLEDNMRETITRLGGLGLPEQDLSRLATFLREGLIAPRREASSDSRVARGRELFTSESVGCSGCHRLDSEASDRALHAVGSRSSADSSDGFRTPPLLFVGGTGPYFHDGRYATLEALLSDNLDRMGQTTQLSSDDLAALAAFLRTL